MTLKRQLIALAVTMTAAIALLAMTRTATADTVPAPTPATLADRGNFRMRCEFSHLASDDPIVFPGQPGASHLHMFFGNTETTAHSSPNDIRTSGNTTCQGGSSANRSGYWIPTVHDTNGGVQVPDFALFYYKTAGLEPGSIQSMPENLRIIAGNSNGSNSTNEAYWTCNGSGRSTTIPNCSSGQTLFLTIHFPSCWDGSNLDSRDHQSHMAYARWNGNGRSCPGSHPVPLPEISFSFQFDPGSASTRGWYLSSDDGAAGGSTLHGDWMNGWNQSVMDTFISNCLHAKRDCTNGQLGNGTKLSQTSSNGRGAAAVISVGDATPTAPTTTDAPAPEPKEAAPAEPADPPAPTTTVAPTTAAPETTAAPTTTAASPATAPPAKISVEVPTDKAEPTVAAQRDPASPLPGGPTCAGVEATIVGTDGNDVLIGTSGQDVIWAGAGHDVIRGLGGNDILCGGAGRDRIFAGKGGDIVSGGAGRDRIRGGAGADTLSGDRGPDRMSGGRGDDILRGGAGTDRLRGASGLDLIFE